MNDGLVTLGIWSGDNRFLYRNVNWRVGREGEGGEMTEYRIAVEKLIKEYKKYIKLLTAELSEAGGIASVHYWESSRVEAGKEARERIEKLEEKVGSD